MAGWVGMVGRVAMVGRVGMATRHGKSGAAAAITAAAAAAGASETMVLMGFAVDAIVGGGGDCGRRSCGSTDIIVIAHTGAVVHTVATIPNRTNINIITTTIAMSAMSAMSAIPITVA